MLEISQILFVTCAGLLFWSYCLYPVLIIGLSWILPQKHRKSAIAIPDSELPNVSIIIPAYNEEGEIGNRIRNLLEQNYPQEKLQIIIASDNSDDGTVEEARKVGGQNITILDRKNRVGKANVLNEIIPNAASEIVALTDANTIWHPDALRYLVEALDDQRIGIAAGYLILDAHSDGFSSAREAEYWNFECSLRQAESRLGGALGANGAIYALRKSQFVPFPPKTAVDDFYEAMILAGKGLRTAFIRDALGFEKTAPSSSGELRRKIRIGAGNFQNLYRLAHLLLPNKGFLALSFFSHKVLRWLGPFFLILIWIACGHLAWYSSQEIWTWLFWLQCTWHILAVLGIILEKTGIHRIPIIFIPSYFDLMNIALLLGCFKAITQKQGAVWNKGR